MTGMETPARPAHVQPALAPEHEWMAGVTLEGRFVRLEPLTEAHAQGIANHADDQTVAMLSRGGPVSNDVAGWTGHIAQLNTLPRRLNWAVVLREGEQVAGRISFSTVQHEDRWVEIGTMLTPPFQGGVCNPEAKLLLMERAFGTLGAGRVQFKVDARNARSRAAMRKLGATEEGVLRRYQVRPDGVARDSVVFSVLPEEWPAVRTGLEARLGLLGRSG